MEIYIKNVTTPDPTHKLTLTALAYGNSPSKMLFAGYKEELIAIYKYKQESSQYYLSQKFNLRYQEISQLLYIDDHNLLLSNSLNSQNIIAFTLSDGLFYQNTTILGALGKVSTFCYNKISKKIFIAECRDRISIVIKQYNPKIKKFVQLHKLQEGLYIEITAISIDQKSDSIFAGNRTGKVLTWDWDNNYKKYSMKQEIKLDDERIDSIAFNEKKRLLLVGEGYKINLFRKKTKGGFCQKQDLLSPNTGYFNSGQLVYLSKWDILVSMSNKRLQLWRFVFEKKKEMRIAFLKSINLDLVKDIYGYSMHKVSCIDQETGVIYMGYGNEPIRRTNFGLDFGKK